MYQRVAKTTAIYPREHAIIYPTLGLTGEAGEVANKVKKLIRDGYENNKDYREALSKEIGDCFGISVYWLTILGLIFRHC